MPQPDETLAVAKLNGIDLCAVQNVSGEVSDAGPEQDRDTAWLASALDEAATQVSRYLMTTTVRDRLGYNEIGDLPGDTPLNEKAVSWAVEYHIDTVDDQGRRRVNLVPKNNYGDNTEPPSVDLVPDEVVTVWTELLDHVRQPLALARLHHLLFQRGGRDRAMHAQRAIGAYTASATAPITPGLHAVQDLVITTRLARAIGDADAAVTSLNLMLDLAERTLADDEPLPGVVLRALEHVVGERDCPARVDDLLDLASKTWTYPSHIDRVLEVALTRCIDDDARKSVWRRRVKVYTDQAESESSKILRAARLQKALQLAEASGDSDLRQATAALLQTVRHDELEYVRFSASSRQYEEEWTQLRDSLIEGDTWQKALVTFGACGPLSGDLSKNTEVVRQREAELPLGRIFPTQIAGPDGLPIYVGQTEQDRFDVDLTRWECEMILHYQPALTGALFEIPARFGIPGYEELSAFLASWPGIDSRLAPAVGRSIFRYWAGDAEAAAFTIVPQIETLLRTLLVSSAIGLYRLQKKHVPGQYPGLGVLVPIVGQLYDLDESKVRFLTSLLTHPAGLNLRNQMSHGLTQLDGPGAAALLIHAALLVGQLRRKEQADEEEQAAE